MDVTKGKVPVAAGFYWRVPSAGWAKRGDKVEVVEKRDGEAFVRFTNGRQESRADAETEFHGPLVPPG